MGELNLDELEREARRALAARNLTPCQYDDQTNIIALIAKVRELERDAERLDWLDDVAHCADWADGEPTKRVIRADDGAEFQGDTWRAAIDAARKEKGHG